MRLPPCCSRRFSTNPGRRPGLAANAAGPGPAWSLPHHPAIIVRCRTSARVQLQPTTAPPMTGTALARASAQLLELVRGWQFCGLSSRALASSSSATPALRGVPLARSATHRFYQRYRCGGMRSWTVSQRPCRHLSWRRPGCSCAPRPVCRWGGHFLSGRADHPGCWACLENMSAAGETFRMPWAHTPGHNAEGPRAGAPTR